MPASQKVQIRDGVVATAVPKNPPDPVYWTDDSPTFEVTISVAQDAEYRTGAENSVLLIVDIDGGFSTIRSVEFGEIDRGSQQSTEITCDPLTYEGHAVCGLSADARFPRNDDTIHLKDGDPLDYSAAYSFSVWDKSHYESTVRRPKHLQYALIATSVVLVGFAILQIIVVAVV